MRRSIVALMSVVVMAATAVVGPTMPLSPTETGPAAAAGAQQQVPGQPYCGPWYIAWYVSYSGWWYGWSWRWCYNPSLQYPWYVDWASWAWGGYAGPGFAPGYYYSVPAGPGPG